MCSQASFSGFNLAALSVNRWIEASHSSRPVRDVHISKLTFFHSFFLAFFQA